MRLVDAKRAFQNVNLRQYVRKKQSILEYLHFNQTNNPKYQKETTPQSGIVIYLYRNAVRTAEQIYVEQKQNKTKKICDFKI